MEQVENVVNERAGLLSAQRLLKPRKVADACRRERYDFAVQERRASRQARDRCGDLWKSSRPVVSLSRAEHDFAVVEPGQQPIAVKLDLVQPRITGGRPSGELRQCRREDVRQFDLMSPVDSLWKNARRC
jgi:hypothetical protein